MRSISRPHNILLAASLCLLLSCPVAARASDVLNSPLELTEAAFRQVGCMQEEQFLYYRDTIQALSYSRMRGLRAFCHLPEISPQEAIDALERMVFYPLRFEQVLLLEYFSELDGASSQGGWRLLDETRDLSFTAMQAAAALPGVEDLSAPQFFELLTRLKALDDTARWAAKSLFGIDGIDGSRAEAGLALISRMGPEQARTAEQACVSYRTEPAAVIEILDQITLLDPADAANARSFLAAAEGGAENSLQWLHTYFSKDRETQERLFYSLSSQQKTALLTAYFDAADYSIRKLNDLHAVTDRFGGEISTGSLAASDREFLEKLFDRLHPGAQDRHRERFLAFLDSEQRYEAIDVLKLATSYARKLTGRDLDSANIYILLSRGSELYDSSFRDILVPILHTRIGQTFNGNLLDFLIRIDPENHHVSDFIVSCAQKGKLTAFFPKNPQEQRKIIDLMAESAFQDEQSLILFSATFPTLLTKIEPEVRTYLIQKMIDTISQPSSVFALQLRVILQFYRDKHAALLTRDDLLKIDAVITRFGAVDFGPYLITDFERWKKDGRLRSLSIFQQDDDGRISYVSNSKNLIKNGYIPHVSSRLSGFAENSALSQEADRLVTAERVRPDSRIGDLYRFSARAGLVVEWRKQVNGLELSHSVAIYRDKTSQRELLKQFLLAKMEMFAQRGHSYWREEQLLEPMRHLLESGQINGETLGELNRFMSIGSCGGLRVYSELNKLFKNQVDIFATVGTGKAMVNDPYNRKLFEIIAASENSLSWEEVARQSASIFGEGRGSDYLQPGSLPAILHKMMDSGSLN